MKILYELNKTYCDSRDSIACLLFIILPDGMFIKTTRMICELENKRLVEVQRKMEAIKAEIIE